MFTQFIDNVFSTVASVPFDTLMWIIWGSFAGIFVLVFLLSLALPIMRSTSKRPFLCLVNAYTAVTLAAYLTVSELPQAILASAIFWVAGYLLYGLLCAVTRPVIRRSTVSQVAMTSLPVPPPQKSLNQPVPAVKNSVRLDHAVSVTEKLLQKNLGRGDRQELEKLKNTLAVLQMKGTLTSAESDILNDNFNALLKLMAKYNV